MARDELLIQLQNDANCTYLSDLHDARSRERVRAAAEALPADAYPLEDWLDALQYITGGAADESRGAEEIRTLLLKRLS